MLLLFIVFVSVALRLSSLGIVMWSRLGLFCYF